MELHEQHLQAKTKASNANGKYCPTNIKAWDGFPDKQIAIWDQVRGRSENLKSARFLISAYAMKTLEAQWSKRKITSELGLESHVKYAVHGPVTDIISCFSKDPDTKEEMHLNGNVIFATHPGNLNDDGQLEARLEKLHLEQPLITPANSPLSLRHMNQICVHQTENGEPIPCFIVEYKAPHKLTIAHIKAGLRPMNPWNDIVNNSEISPESDRKAKVVYYSSRFIAAVVTQTFSSMIEAGLEYGYICTGQAFIFLHVQPDDPTTVYYYLSIPNDDVGENVGWEADSDGPNRFHLTAIGQVLAFTLQTLLSRQQDPDWIKETKRRLKRWVVDPMQLLPKIPEVVRKDIENTLFKPPPQEHSDLISLPFFRSGNPHFNNTSTSNSDETVEYGDPVTSSRNQSASKGTITESYRKWYERKDHCRAMAYCTQRCLRGLLTGGLLDEDCPNFGTHRKRDKYHCLDSSTFRELMRKQLSDSLVTDCHALDKQGSRGALFKVRLTSHGYTVAAKCTIWAYISDLLHEAEVYKQLKEIQGIYIPVCLGNIDLPDVLAYSSVHFVHMMFLSWGGQCIELQPELFEEPHIMDQAVEAMRAIHQLGVLHCDTAPRNILWSEDVNHVMFIDFEQSKIKKVLRKRPHMLNSDSEPGKGEAGENLTEWKSEMRLNRMKKAKEDDEVDSNANFEREMMDMRVELSMLTG